MSDVRAVHVGPSCRLKLGSSDPEARLASIQRLAGWGLASSRKELHEVMAHGTEAESKWALFAAPKTGRCFGCTVGVPTLLDLCHDKPEPYPQPDGAIALALQKLRAPRESRVLTIEWRALPIGLGWLTRKLRCVSICRPVSQEQ